MQAPEPPLSVSAGIGPIGAIVFVMAAAIALIIAAIPANAVRTEAAANTAGTQTSKSSPPLDTQATVKDAALEKRALLIAGELRCLVCQNQTLADSNAELAVDLRKQIYEQLKAGAGDAQIKEFMVRRYGDFVLYRPPVKVSTALLWFGPLLLLLAGAVFAVRFARRQRPAAGRLSDAEEQRARALLDGSGNEIAPGSTFDGTRSQ